MNKKMSLDQAKSIVGNQPSWVLPSMIKALEILGLFNTQEETNRLQSAKIVMRANRKHKR